MNILFITFGLPFPPSSGARIRDFNLISRLGRHHAVSVLSLLESPDELQHIHALGRYCEHVDGVVAEQGMLALAGIALDGLVHGRPLATAPFHSPELARRIRALSTRQRFDLVQIEHSFLAPYRFALAASFDGVTVLSLHNIGVQQYRSMFDMSAGRARVAAAIKWLAMRHWEALWVRRFDHCIVVSEEDRLRLRALGVDDRVSSIDNGVDTTLLQRLPDPPAGGAEILFIGTMGYLPNRDAMEYFCRDILPLIRAERPDCRLSIVGSGAAAQLAHLAQEGVVDIIDRVEDPVPFYRRARLAVVPLRSGGGSRLKILEAMALGRPVVSTTLGCEGLELEAGKELLTADEPDSFARQVLALLGDKGLWNSVVQAARRKVESHYDWSLVTERLLQLYQDLQARRGNIRQPAPWTRAAASTEAPPLAVIIPVFNAEASLGRCLDALQRSSLAEFELIIVDDCSTDASAEIARARCGTFAQMEQNSGQGAARNRGSQLARSQVLFFLDADVLVEPDTLQRVLDTLAEDPGVVAMFCSYQQDTPENNFFSQYKNLQHHYTHQVSGREAATFCGGYGAIYSDVFSSMGGFDSSRRVMEDVELGYRLHQAGHRIVLNPGIQLTHTKRYTLAGLVYSDVFQRAVPWTKIMLERRVFRSDLNLRSNNLASMLVVCMMLVVPFLSLPAATLEGVLLVLFIALNHRFLAFLRQVRGSLFALGALPMMWLQYCYSGVGLVLGALGYLKDRAWPKKPAARVGAK